MSVQEHSLDSARRAPAKRSFPGMRLAQHLLRGIQRWQRNRARVALEQLDDRQLAEVGIARNDIPWVVEQLFRSNERSVRTPSPSFRQARGRSEPERRRERDRS